MATIETITEQLLQYCLPEEVEIEARFSGNIITTASINRLLNNRNITWKKSNHNERRLTSINNNTCTYRQRDEDIICKSFIYKEILYDLWCSMFVNTEKNIPSMRNKLQQIEPVKITRYSGQFKGHQIDITYDDINTIPRLEIEVLDSTIFTIENTKVVIVEVCKILQDSENFMGQYMWRTIFHIEKRQIIDRKYQKPVTMSIREFYDIQYNIKDWVVTAKVDGVRRFIIIYGNTIYSSDIQGFTKLEYKMHNVTDTPTILDAEYVEKDNIFYIFDIIMFNGRDCMNMSFYYRMKLLNNIEITNIQNMHIKKYHTFKSFNDLTQIYNKMGKTYIIDGLIFVNTKKPYLQSVPKWKMNTTVDLKIVTENQTRKLITSDNHQIDIQWDDKYPTENGIWEFKYTNKTLIPIKNRYDKPTANSKLIVKRNILTAIPGTIFVGTGCYLMRKYHNRVKNRMLQNIRTDMSILVDIGTGQGGDYTKWSNISEVYCIEPSLTAIEEMNKRIKSDTRIKIMNKLIRDIDIDDIPNNINVFTAFFCTNLFVKQDWSKFFELINKKSSKTCIVLIIALTNPKENDNKVFSLKMTTENTYNISLYETRIIDIDEYVVPIDDLTRVMGEYGLTKTLEQPLNRNMFMSENEKMLSSMYTQIIFKRTN